MIQTGGGGVFFCHGTGELQNVHFSLCLAALMHLPQVIFRSGANSRDITYDQHHCINYIISCRKGHNACAACWQTYVQRHWRGIKKKCHNDVEK